MSFKFIVTQAIIVRYLTPYMSTTTAYNVIVLERCVIK